MLVVTLPTSTRDVGELLSAAHSAEKAENRTVLHIIISNIRFLGRQGIPLRGKYHDEESGESDSNFIRLLKLREEDNTALVPWMSKSQDKFTSPSIQNEILQIMSQSILRGIATKLSGQWFTIMVDESTDCSNTEQLVFCLRWVDSALEVHEEFIGIHSMDKTDAETIAATIKDILLRLGLNITNCRGQCYDGAAAMCGRRTGVVTRILAEEPRALYTHCYGHSLNLACQDSMKAVPLMSDTLDTVYEITKLIKKSPKREALFTKFKDVTESSPGIRILCPTRWTVRGEALNSIIENYGALQDTWSAAKDLTTESEMRARINGVNSLMNTFDFFFGLYVGRLILRITDNASCALQGTAVSATSGQRVMELTVKTLESMRSDEQFQLLWQVVQQHGNDLGVSPAVLPRKRKTPRRYEIGDDRPSFPDTVESYYRRTYFQVIDVTVASIRNRFNQEGYKMLLKIENLLTLPSNQEHLNAISRFYGLDLALLKTQLQMFEIAVPADLKDVSERIKFLQVRSPGEKSLFSEVIKLAIILLVMPATNAVSERSFSALRRIKTWLRGTMTQVRLNSCMILHVHKSKTDSLDLIQVANEFVLRNESRRKIFGTQNVK